MGTYYPICRWAAWAGLKIVRPSRLFPLPLRSQSACLHLSAPADGDLIILAKAVGNDRNIAAKPTKRPGRRRRMSRPSSRGRLKAVAADFCQLINSPSTRKDSSVLPAMNPGSQIPPGTRAGAFPRFMPASPHGLADARIRQRRGLFKRGRGGMERDLPSPVHKRGTGSLPVCQCTACLASAPCGGIFQFTRHPAGSPPPRSTDRHWLIPQSNRIQHHATNRPIHTSRP